MINGIKYLPFRLYKNKMNNTKYQFIKHGQYNQFWSIHKNSNMSASNVDLLLNLFEQMFEYNPHERLTISSILQHEWIVQNKDDISFYINDSTLETFVRDIYHQCQDINHNRQSFHSAVSQYTQLSDNTSESKQLQSSQLSSETDSFNLSQFVKEMNGLDSSRVAPAASHKELILKNKIYYAFKPLVVMIGIEKYKNYCNKKYIANDYINVKNMLNHARKYDLVYQYKNGKIIYDRNDDANNDSNIVHQFKTEWTCEEINNFNQYIVSNILDSDKTKYDGLIYFLSLYMKHDNDNKYSHYFYDSNDQLHDCNHNIVDIFNNVNCKTLYKKPKIFIFD